MIKSEKDIGKNPSLKQLVYEYLKEKIINGELEQGVKINEDELCRKMSISKAPIREAFNMLERDGYIIIIPRRGTFVSEVTLEAVQNIYEMRRLIEPYAAKISVDDVPEERLSKVYEKICEVEKNPSNLALYMESDLETHELASAYLKNSYIKNSIENMRTQSMRSRWVHENTSQDNRDIILTDTKEHMEIVKAFQERNGDKAYDAMMSHLTSSIRRLLKK